ncbi:uncharacterized protein LOC123811256 [Phyllostomus hastatus]|uniref:uncharacterized protein LOC123811256 n=1 Tax=Phyllostomus hastatus TaxID=9423 RepID=UPI001E680E85|nr:uncharacterized protein LOC123811256 [Phyllostomus hastatus]
MGIKSPMTTGPHSGLEPLGTSWVSSKASPLSGLRGTRESLDNTRALLRQVQDKSVLLFGGLGERGREERAGAQVSVPGGQPRSLAVLLREKPGAGAAWKSGLPLPVTAGPPGVERNGSGTSRGKNWGKDNVHTAVPFSALTYRRKWGSLFKSRGQVRVDQGVSFLSFTKFITPSIPSKKSDEAKVIRSPSPFLNVSPSGHCTRRGCFSQASRSSRRGDLPFVHPLGCELSRAGKGIHLEKASRIEEDKTQVLQLQKRSRRDILSARELGTNPSPALAHRQLSNSAQDRAPVPGQGQHAGGDREAARHQRPPQRLGSAGILHLWEAEGPKRGGGNRISGERRLDPSTENRTMSSSGLPAFLTLVPTCIQKVSTRTSGT